MKRICWFLYFIYALLLFIATLIPVFLSALVASLFGDIRGGNWIYLICRTWADVWFFCVGIYHRNIYESKPDPTNACIYVANHIAYLDAALIVKVVRFPVRPLGKIEITKIPLFGFVYRKTIVTVDRASASHRAESVRKLVKYLSHGISIFIFPEGTLNETGEVLKSFYDGAFRIAIETGRPIRPVLLLDSYDRMNYKSIFSLRPGRSRAVFLEPVSVAGLQASDVPALKEKVRNIMETKLIAYRNK